MAIKVIEDDMSRVNDQKLRAYGIDPNKMYDSSEFEVLRVWESILLEMKNRIQTKLNHLRK